METIANALTGTALLKQSRELHDRLDKLQEAGVKAFQAGQKAKREGLFRVSPYYEKPELDACFFAGYDEAITAPGFWPRA